MDKYAVFGNPIEHSLSPLIHQQFAKQTGVEISYEKILAPNNGFKQKAKQFIAENAKGFNITVPFKLDALELADTLTLEAKTAGAVNTIKVDNHQLIGHNTDGIGLVKDLTINLGIDLKDKIVLILGAGGATRGVLFPLLANQPKRLMIANRTASKAEQLADDFSAYGTTYGFGLEKINNNPVDIIINATSASLDGQMPQIASGCAKDSVCYDLMYGTQTPFMKWALKNQARLVVDGLGMLVEQAAAAFEFWTGKHPNTTEVIKKLRS